ncbi:hypothetical protein MON38_18520 [Hymenobacter sp. DH14]|uniref:Uncharacterized protein n=1 Tax=Hymenobacter cyanobacteriorum TaxID=2926463 RepID=A0A9X1VJU0_9BACT|nr:hypothetical protein [Hymenobacter cyanobacteriorum]MCI1189422.1 hypothetical protein [Hymenobacter cyanobacteriorum]
MHCAAPSIRAKGEAEVSAILHVNTRVEGAVAYSPLSHVLVRAAGSLKKDQNDSIYFRVKQFEAAVGGYWPLREYWVVGALVGGGAGHNQRGFRDVGLFGSSSVVTYRQYDGQYRKIFGEAYAMYQRRIGSVGVASRLTQVHFDELSDRGIALGPASTLRLEPMVFGRMGPYAGRFNCLQFQVAAGLSVDCSSRRATDYSTRNVFDNSLFVSFGAVFYPHRLSKRAPQP